MAQPTDKHIQESLNSFVAPRLPKLDLPPLPPITDRKLRETVFTHVSSRVLPKRFATTMFLTDGQAGNDYEKLEHVGDALLGAAVKTMLHEQYPNFRQGTASTTYDKLVCNRTLAQIAVQYGLPDMVQCHITQRHVLKKNQKVQASVFEAYIAGLYYSVLNSGNDGTQRATVATGFDPSPSTGGTPVPLDHSIEASSKSPTTDTDKYVVLAEGSGSDTSSSDNVDHSRTSDDEDDYEGLVFLFGEVEDCQASSSDSASDSCHSTDTAPSIDSFACSESSQDSSHSPADSLTSSDTTPKPSKTRGEAYDAVFNWIRDLFEPIAVFVVEHLKVEEKRLKIVKETSPRGLAADMPQEWVEEDIKARGGKATLHAENSIMELPEYTESKIDQWRGNTLWKVACRVTDIDGRVWTAEATRYTKQNAANVAAWKLCVQMGVLGADVQ
ncbi:hypothetical protein IAU59_003585 [Kwoniella sp. CBS 9459]